MNIRSAFKPRQLVFAAGYVIVLILFVEIAANAAISLILGKSAPYSDSYENDPNLTLLTWMDQYESHPYFGYYDPSSLTARLEPLTRKGPDDFVVGLFGGSVAEMLGYFLAANPEHLHPLKKVVPGAQARNIRVVNFAHGGYKQPQQFFVASYYLDKVDLLVNLEGFMEMVTPANTPLFPLEYPITSLRDYRTGSVESEIWAAIGRRLKGLYRTLNQLPIKVPGLSHSHTYFLFWQVSHRGLYLLIEKIDARVQESAVGSRPPAQYDEKRRIWKKYVAMQASLAAGYRKPAVFFLQPNQYLRGSKPLSQEERLVAINPRTADELNTAMQVAQTAVPDLRRSGVEIHDLTGAFASVPETLYVDACCHLNAKGNDILATVLVDKLVGSIRDARLKALPGALRALLKHPIADEASLIAAAAALGLKRSDKITGYVDDRSRGPGELLSLRGWAKDDSGNGPLTVMLFGGGRDIALTEAWRPRPDVDPKGDNIAFRVDDLKCDPGSSLVAVAINRDGEFAPLKFWRMAPRC